MVSPLADAIPADSCPRCCKRIQAEVSELGSFRVAINGRYATLFVQFVRCDQHRPPVACLPCETLKLLLPYTAPGTACSSISACSAFSSALAHSCFNCNTDAAADTLPSTRISSFSGTVFRSVPLRERIVPLYVGFAPCFSGRRILRSGWRPRRTAQTPPPALLRPHPPAPQCPCVKPHSATVTAKPPSVQSLADSTRPSSIIWMMAFCSAASFSSSNAGGNPQIWPRISLANSDDPNSASASAASPGSDPRSKTIAWSDLLEVRPHGFVHVFQDADDTHHRRGINPSPRVSL